MSPLRVLAAIAFELAVLGCDASVGRRQGDGALSRQSDAGTAAPFLGARFLAVQVVDPWQIPRVLDLERKTLDGDLVDIGLASDALSIAFVDSSGRAVTIDVDADGREPWSGRRESCRGGECSNEEVTARRLWSGERSPVGFSLVSEIRGEWGEARALSVDVRGELAAVSLGEVGLAVIDVADPHAPRIVYDWRPPDDGESITDVAFLDARWLLAASWSGGVRSFDLAAADSDVAVIDAAPGSNSDVHTLFVAARRAYAARISPFGGLDILDFRDPTAPSVVAVLELPSCEQLHEVFVEETLLLASCLDDGLVAFDVSDEMAPRLIARWPGEKVHSAQHLGDGLVVATSERLAAPFEVLRLDVERGTFSLLARFSLGTGASTHELECRSGRCWLSYYQEGLLELDLHTPERPRVSRRFPSWNHRAEEFFEGASSAVAAGELLYVADTTRGLLVLERE